MRRRGFTIVELLITITIIGILLIVGVVNLQSTQANGRDTERKTDVETIALHLEMYYKTGTDSSTTFGRYPSTGIIGQETTTLRDIDPRSLSAPGQTASSLVAATCAGVCVQTTAGVLPQPTINQYVYQVLQPDGTLCTPGVVDCRKFNLFYRLESDNTVYKLTSKNQ